MLPKPSAFIFDWDGTLVNTVPFIYAAVNKTHDHFGQPHEDPANVRHYTSYVKEESFAMRFGEANATEALRLYESFIDDVHDPYFADPANHAALMMPGTAKLLDFLYKEPIKNNILSNKTSRWLHSEIKYFGWQKYFGVVYGAQDIPYNKPDPRAAHYLLKSADLLANEHIWFVGDSFADIACAQAAGLTSIYIGADEYNYGPQPTAMFTNLNDLYETLISLDFSAE